MMTGRLTPIGVAAVLQRIALRRSPVTETTARQLGLSASDLVRYEKGQAVPPKAVFRQLVGLMASEDLIFTLATAAENADRSLLKKVEAYFTSGTPLKGDDALLLRLTRAVRGLSQAELAHELRIDESLGAHHEAGAEIFQAALLRHVVRLSRETAENIVITAPKGAKAKAKIRTRGSRLRLHGARR
jgi:transcriptional regulator with XRE-family HTH domain